MKPIYLDHNATTPLDPKVLKVMEPYLKDRFGNPSSLTHQYGWEASAAVDLAREQICDLLQLESPENVIFTSGTTESNNFVLKGFALSQKNKIHIITQETEHKSILKSLEWIQTLGHDVTILKVNQTGQIDLKELENSIRKETRLVSIMGANNEIGTLYPIDTIAEICHKHGILFHSDFAQEIGNNLYDYSNIDFLTFSGHKIYGPKGIGVVLIGREILKNEITPLLHGGSHEFQLRAGTLNVPGIIGLAHALEIKISDIKNKQKIKNLTQRLKETLLNEGGSILNGPHDLDSRLLGNLNISFKGIPAEKLITKTPQLAFSSGSACTSSSPKPSHVLTAITQDEDRINAAIRLSIGRFTTQEEVDKTAKILIESIHQLQMKD